MTGRPIGEKASIYDSTEFTLPLNSSLYDVKANQASFLANAKIANAAWVAWVLRIVTDQTITLRLNKTTNPAITITSSESPYIIEDVAVSNIFLSNSTAANLKIVQYYI